MSERIDRRERAPRKIRRSEGEGFRTARGLPTQRPTLIFLYARNCEKNRYARNGFGGEVTKNRREVMKGAQDLPRLSA